MIEEFKEFLLGSFNNRKQAFSFPSQYSQISLKHVLLNNGMLYGEQKYTVRGQPPYRQFVLDIKEVDEKIIVSSYKVKNGKNHLEFKNLNDITDNDLELNENCECIFIKEGNNYIGRIIGCDCIVERNGKKTFLFTMSVLSKDVYRVIDRGYDPKTKKMVWGSEHGMFEFNKESI